MQKSVLWLLLCLLTSIYAKAQICSKIGNFYPDIPITVCPDGASVIPIPNAEVFEGWVHSIIISSSEDFTASDQYLDTITTSIFYNHLDELTRSEYDIRAGLPEGQYYLFALVAPPDNLGKPDFTPDWPHVSAAKSLTIANLVVGQLPDTIRIPCQGPYPVLHYPFVEGAESYQATFTSRFTAADGGIDIWIEYDSLILDKPMKVHADLLKGHARCDVEPQVVYVVYEEIQIPQISGPVLDRCDAGIQFCFDTLLPNQQYYINDQEITERCQPSFISYGINKISIGTEGCPELSQNIKLWDAGEILEVEKVITPPSCAGQDGIIQIIPRGGVPPYELQFESQPTIIIENEFDTVTFSGLDEDQYSFSLIDEAGCNPSGFSNINLEVAPPILVHVGQVDCITGYASFDIEVIGEDGPYTYEDIEGNPWAYFDSIHVSIPGPKIVYAVQDNGCRVGVSFGFNAHPYYTQDIRLTSAEAGCGYSNGQATVLVRGESYPYTYQWSDGTNSCRIDSAQYGFYSVTITDSKNCTFTRDVLVGEEPSGRIRPAYSGSLFCNDTVTVTIDYENFTDVPDSIETVFWLDPYTLDTIAQSLNFVTTEPIRLQAYARNHVSTCSYSYPVIVDGPMSGENPYIVANNYNECGFPILSTPFSIIDPNWILPDSTMLTQPGSFRAEQEGWYYISKDFPISCSDGSTTYLLDSFYVVDTSSCGILQGQLLLDTLDNCSGNNSIAIPNKLISVERLTPDPKNYYALTHTNGYWRIQVPDGDYELQAVQLSNSVLYEDCLPLPQITASDNTLSDTTKIIVIPSEDCAQVVTDIIVPRLRRCFDNEIYVTYKNRGPDPVYNARLLLDLDNELIIQSSSLPISDELPDGRIAFDLGNLRPFDEGYISIDVLVSCLAQLGREHCIHAEITPSAPCPSPPDFWTGATVTAIGECINDQSFFTITNIGDGDMSVPIQYIVIEDGVMLSIGEQSSPALTAGQELVIGPYSSGSNYWIYTNQEPFSPGDIQPSAYISGCNTQTEIASEDGNFNSFDDGDIQPQIDHICLVNTGAFDPNDKTAVPVGYGPDHFIEPDNSIDYLIRFQNTGTDTAFNVRLVDTLDTDLDLSTFEVLSASHDFRPELD
ncbi:MAG: hypothetical protein AAGF87_16845, partial [Bacteroidota bacterium]